MTSSRARWSAMARRPGALLLGVLALVTAGHCLNCKVCIPALAGDKPDQKEAARWRANISRTFANKAESDFQVCGEAVDPTKEQAESSCPWNTDDVVCLDIVHWSWRALTCGRIPVDSDLSCYNTPAGSQVCPCPNNYCNGGWRGAVASTATIATLLAVALAAVW